MCTDWAGSFPRSGTSSACSDRRRVGSTTTHPKRAQTRGVAYLTFGEEAFVAAIGEAFPDGTGAGVGPLDLTTKDPQITRFDLAAPLALLDLDGGWVTRAGGNQSIRTGSRARSRAWSRLIYEHHRGSVMGLAYRSSVWGPGRCVALWENGAAALPALPSATRRLDDPVLRKYVVDAAHRLGTSLTP